MFHCICLIIDSFSFDLRDADGTQDPTLPVAGWAEQVEPVRGEVWLEQLPSLQRQVSNNEHTVQRSYKQLWLVKWYPFFFSIMQRNLSL